MHRFIQRIDTEHTGLDHRTRIDTEAYRAAPSIGTLYLRLPIFKLYRDARIDVHRIVHITSHKFHEHPYHC